MPRIKVDSDAGVLPPAEYLCKTEEVELKQTNDGHEMWRVRHRVIDGEFSGETIFDNWPFSPGALKRISLIASRYGLPDGELDMQPQHVLQKLVYVKTKIGNWEGVKRTEVEFAGYRLATDATTEQQATAAVVQPDNEPPI